MNDREREILILEFVKIAFAERRRQTEAGQARMRALKAQLDLAPEEIIVEAARLTIRA